MNWYKISQVSIGKLVQSSKYKVVDDKFNQANYPSLIGKLFDSPPSYAHVKVIKEDVKNTKKTKKTAMVEGDIQENVRFYDPQYGRGKIVTRKYNQTTLWMMLYDDGTIEELTNSDLKRIQKT